MPFNAMEAYEEVLINPDTPTHISRPSNNFLTLDLAIASPGLAPICECKVKEDIEVITFLLKYP